MSISLRVLKNSIWLVTHSSFSLPLLKNSLSLFSLSVFVSLFLSVCLSVSYSAFSLLVTLLCISLYFFSLFASVLKLSVSSEFAAYTKRASMHCQDIACTIILQGLNNNWRLKLECFKWTAKTFHMFNENLEKPIMF